MSMETSMFFTFIMNLASVLQAVSLLVSTFILV
ncbi:hypothetical protein T05_7027 [Trichinella murrelli]|uniref:Uncharacterized protein n=1 Tax=Trichinella murrelli TaxID=144512 RepID=A0A0V0SW57_9BILA|nr:hypothetical protein T05_7027 [Trichinella murrelli]